MQRFLHNFVHLNKSVLATSSYSTSERLLSRFKPPHPRTPLLSSPHWSTASLIVPRIMSILPLCTLTVVPTFIVSTCCLFFAEKRITPDASPTVHSTILTEEPSGRLLVHDLLGVQNLDQRLSPVVPGRSESTGTTSRGSYFQPSQTSASSVHRCAPRDALTNFPCLERESW